MVIRNNYTENIVKMTQEMKKLEPENKTDDKKFWDFLVSKRSGKLYPIYTGKK